MQKQQGFTLIELMIVVAIIGILAAIAIPQYQNYVARAQMTEAFTLTDGLKTDVVSFYAENGKCPSNTDAGFGEAGNYSGSYVATVTLTGDQACKIEAQMETSGVAKGISGKTLSLTMSDNSGATTGGSASWECSSNAESQYLPSSCQKEAEGNG